MNHNLKERKNTNQNKIEETIGPEMKRTGESTGRGIRMIEEIINQEITTIIIKGIETIINVKNKSFMSQEKKRMELNVSQ